MVGSMNSLATSSRVGRKTAGGESVATAAGLFLMTSTVVGGRAGQLHPQGERVGVQGRLRRGGALYLGVTGSGTKPRPE